MKECKCEVCGAVIERQHIPGRVKYCDACRAEERRAASLRKYHKRAEQRKAEKAAGAIAPVQAKSLDAFVRELERYNAERREAGLVPVSYGRYVAFRDDYINKV